MNFTDYQTRSHKTAKYPVIGHEVIYPTLGLAVGSTELVKKFISVIDK